MLDYRYDYLFEDDNEDLNLLLSEAKETLKNAKLVEFEKREINAYSYVRVNHYTKVLRKK